MKDRLNFFMVAAILTTMFLPSTASSETKTWTTDTDLKEGNRERVEIIGKGTPASLALAACPNLRIMTIDGNFTDWNGIRALDTLPQSAEEEGDVSAIALDIKDVWAANNDMYLYVRWKCAGTMSFDNYDYSLYLDTDQNTATGFRGFDGNWAVGADYLLQDGNLYRYTGGGADWSWVWIKEVSHALGNDGETNDTIEAAILREDIGQMKCSDEAVALLFVTASGATNEDFAPNDKINQILTYNYAKPVMIVDGDPKDWDGIASLVTDPQDMVDADADVKAGYAVSDENYLYLRLDVYGDINPVGHWYIIYLDTDQNNTTGLTFSWWATGADYRLLFDEYNVGLQKFMGANQNDDIWGWNGNLYGLETANTHWVWNSSAGILEFEVLKSDIEEIATDEATNILLRISGDDCAPYYNSGVAIYKHLR